MGRIINDDSRNLSSLLDSSKLIQTTITSPPYFDMKDYGVDNQIGFGQSYSEYLSDLSLVFKQVLDITAENGTLWIIIDTFKRNGNIVLLPYDIANKLKEIGWHLQNIIIWKKDKTVPWSSGGFVQRKFEYILFFSKNEKYKSYKDRVRVSNTSMLKSWWVRYPERYNPKGKALDEIWEFPIPVQGSWGKEYIRHFCPLPKELVETMISISTDEGDIVLDPFSGTGAVLSQAAYMNREYIGVELNSEYAQKCRDYIESSIEKGRQEFFLVRDNKDGDFERTIVSLRALKYGRLLLVNLEKELEMKGQLKIYVGIPSFNRDTEQIVVPYILVGDMDIIKVSGFISSILSIPPFSKYGIDPIIDFSEELPLGADKMYYYTRSNTHQYLKDVLSISPKVAVLSPICMDINEKAFE